MTLTQLRYAIALAQLKHFGRAAEHCQISQPSLSVALKKLEDELGIKLFERKSTEVIPTVLGLSVIEQAQHVLEEVDKITKCVASGKDPLSGDLRLGVIYTVAPYLLPKLIERIHVQAPSMPLILAEGYTAELLESLKTGEIDCAIVASPVNETALASAPLYAEDFVVALPHTHPLANATSVSKTDLKNEPMLLLGAGHCLRDQVLNFCMDTTKTDPLGHHTPLGSSLATIMQMVSEGLGVTVIPASASPTARCCQRIRVVPFVPINRPQRIVNIVWRKSFPRPQAIEALIKATHSLTLEGCRPIENVAITNLSITLV